MSEIVYHNKQFGRKLILGEAEWWPADARDEWGDREGPQTHEQWNQYLMVKKRKLNGDSSLWKKPPWRVRPIIGQMYRGEKYPVPHPWSSMKEPVCPICDGLIEENGWDKTHTNCSKQTSLTDFRMLGDENESHPPRQ